MAAMRYPAREARRALGRAAAQGVGRWVLGVKDRTRTRSGEPPPSIRSLEERLDFDFDFEDERHRSRSADANRPTQQISPTMPNSENARTKELCAVRSFTSL